MHNKFYIEQQAFPDDVYERTCMRPHTLASKIRRVIYCARGVQYIIHLKINFDFFWALFCHYNTNFLFFFEQVIFVSTSQLLT